MKWFIIIFHYLFPIQYSININKFNTNSNKYEERINCFINRIDKFKEDIDNFDKFIRIDLKYTDVLDPVQLKIKQAFIDLEKFEYNVNKIDKIKEKIKDTKKKLKKLFKKFNNELEITKEDLN